MTECWNVRYWIDWLKIMEENNNPACFRCNSFKNSNIKGYGFCVGNSAAYKEMNGKKFSRGAPEGPSFKVRKLDKCSRFERVF